MIQVLFFLFLDISKWKLFNRTDSTSVLFRTNLWILLLFSIFFILYFIQYSIFFFSLTLFSLFISVRYNSMNILFLFVIFRYVLEEIGVQKKRNDFKMISLCTVLLKFKIIRILCVLRAWYTFEVNDMENDWLLYNIWYEKIYACKVKHW